MSSKTALNDAETLLRKYIAENDYGPGSRLPTHEELAAILGVGSRPLREALSVLQRQGLIETRGRGGTIVSEPKDEHYIEPIELYFENLNVSDSELVYARAILEAALVEEACKHRTLKDMLLMQQCIENQAQPGIDRDAEMEFDKQFHLALMNATHNKVFSVFAKLILIGFEIIYKHNLDLEEQEDRRVQDHEEILTAVHDRDEERARELLMAHILGSHRKLRKR